MKLDNLSKWDKRFLDLAQTVGGWSKGPRKRVGAVIARPDRSVASMGYNGPPRGYDDDAFMLLSRDEQHKVVVHAEINAIQQLLSSERLMLRTMLGYTLYVSPLYPCVNCAASIIAYGVKRVVAYCVESSDDWAESAKAAEQLFLAHNVEYIKVVQ